MDKAVLMSMTSLGRMDSKVILALFRTAGDAAVGFIGVVQYSFDKRWRSCTLSYSISRSLSHLDFLSLKPPSQQY